VDKLNKVINVSIGFWQQVVGIVMSECMGIYEVTWEKVINISHKLINLIK
jgi:hypothetical protein